MLSLHPLQREVLIEQALVADVAALSCKIAVPKKPSGPSQWLA